MNEAMCKRFVGKKVVVTGGAQGIGKSAAKRIGLEGATVLIVDKSEEALNVVEELKQHGVDAHCVLADLESHEGVCEAYENALNVLGHIDVLVNNVGGTIWLKPFIEYQPDQIEKEVSRSFWPTMWSCYVFAKYFVEQRAGVIVNVSSIASRATYRVPYSSCKGGVNFLTTSLAMELGEYGIRVNAVCPGDTFVDRWMEKGYFEDSDPVTLEQAIKEASEFIPMGRFGKPEEIANAVLFLASDESSYVTGHLLLVDGGNTAQ